MTRPRVGLATCAELPDLDPPERLLLAPLEARGVLAEPVVWDDEAVVWSAYDAVVLRCTWDYPPRHQEFLAWTRLVEQATTLLNPAAVVAWNTDKRYLRELDEAGIPVVPTTYVGPQDPAPSLPTAGEYVVKPTVSAGSIDTARYRAAVDDDVARGHLGRLRAQGRTAMVQPYLDTVDTRGETALLHIEGRLSHAIRKGPLLQAGGRTATGLFAQEDISVRTPTQDEQEVAAAVMAVLDQRFGSLLYARVDLVDTAEGPVLLELELAEPSLFIETDPDAPDRLADAILARLA